MLYRSLRPVDEETFRGKGFVRPAENEDYTFAKEIEFVPLGFSEIVPCSMWYPIFFGRAGEKWEVFAILGAGGKNIFVNPDGTWKTRIIPKVLQLYPFTVQKDQEKGDYLVLVDEIQVREEGDPFFEPDGSPSPYLESIKEELAEWARDRERVLEMMEEVIQHKLLAPFEVEHHFPFGKFSLKNAFTTDIKAFWRLQPEKLYYLNTKGYFPILFVQNFSLRNLALFELFYLFEGQVKF